MRIEKKVGTTGLLILVWFWLGNGQENRHYYAIQGLVVSSLISGSQGLFHGLGGVIHIITKSS